MTEQLARTHGSTVETGPSAQREAEPAVPAQEPPAPPRRAGFDEPRWRRWLRRGVAGVMLLIGLVAWLSPAYMLLLMTFAPMAIVVVTIVQRVVGRFQGRLVTGFAADPLSVENRPYLVQLAIRGALPVLVFASALLTIQRFGFTDAEYRTGLLLWVVGPVVAFILLQLIPTRPVSRSLNAVALVVVAFLGYQLVQVHFVRTGLDDAVDIASPFEREWIITSGGPSALVSHHYLPIVNFQDDAIDIVISVDSRPFDGDQADLASHHIWDEPVLAPADGVVVAVENDLPDLPVGEMDADNAAGNHVIVDIGDGRYVMYGHLKNGSVTVVSGDRVEVGQVIGRIGNSGNTGGPHLHLQVQDTPEFGDLGGNTFPIRFTDATHIRGGTEYAEQQGQLRRNDIIRPER